MKQRLLRGLVLWRCECGWFLEEEDKEVVVLAGAGGSQRRTGSIPLLETLKDEPLIGYWIGLLESPGGTEMKSGTEILVSLVNWAVRQRVASRQPAQRVQTCNLVGVDVETRDNQNARVSYMVRMAAVLALKVW